MGWFGLKLAFKHGNECSVQMSEPVDGCAGPSAAGPVSRPLMSTVRHFFDLTVITPHLMKRRSETFDERWSVAASRLASYLQAAAIRDFDCDPRCVGRCDRVFHIGRNYIQTAA